MSFILLHKMLDERERLTNQIQSLHSQIKNFPEGNIICTRNQKRYKWYLSNGRKPIYIPKKDRAFAEMLAQKKYLSTLLNELITEKHAIDSYLKHHSTSSSKSNEMLSNTSAYHELLSPYFKPQSQDSLEWVEESYPNNPKHPEQLTHKTSSGHMVRSKSEALIDMLLYVNRIPFRYECELNLGNMVLYPDFTIRHPSTGQIYYWEHFGMMDDPTYYKNAYSKMQLYNAHGIIPSIHLITTFETKEYPLSTDVIEKKIQEFFL